MAILGKFFEIYPFLPLIFLSFPTAPFPLSEEYTANGSIHTVRYWWVVGVLVLLVQSTRW